MKERLKEIIQYKTGGSQKDFAELIGWSRQYLSRLLNSGSFGLEPVMALLSKLPEINARWLLFGQGEMLEIGKLFNLQRETFAQVSAILELEKLIPFMTPIELHEYEQAVTTGRKPNFSPETLVSLKQRANEHEHELNAVFSAAINKSNELCNQKTVKP